MGIAEKIIPHYTYDDWVHWEGRWELIDGYPIAMSPAPTPGHQRISAKIITELILALRKSNCLHCEVYNFLDYKIEDDIILQPDVLIVCGEIQKKYLDFPPTLVVEILSPSTGLRDRHTKYQFYQQQGIPYYLIVDVEQKKIEIYKLTEGVYQLQEAGASYEFHLTSDCAITPQLNTVFD